MIKNTVTCKGEIRITIWTGYTRGVNLGGWLSQCPHTRERYETFIGEEDIHRIRDWGLDHIRVPVDYELVEDAQGARREEGFAYIQRAIDWSRDCGLNMILDLHKTCGFSFDAGEHECGFFEDAALQERFYRLWEEFARRFGRYADTLSFELLNEVTEQRYCAAWNRIAAACIARIRAIAPTVKILVGGYWNNSIEALPDLLSPPDGNIVYTFHCYEPLIFTHQGAYWIPGMDLDFRLSADTSYGEMEACSRRELKHWHASFDGLDPAGRLDAEYFAERFAEAVRVAGERGAGLYCGEYGVIDRAAPEDQLRWYACIHEAFERCGIGRAAWSYRAMDFGLADKRLDGVRERLLALL
ncbi:MAG: cellulase family glycosylhydrolase [Eubacteriales bacterium]|nr:cellulase family glycosylhydrolase [Eubacteriales bacterium]